MGLCQKQKNFTEISLTCGFLNSCTVSGAAIFMTSLPEEVRTIRKLFSDNEANSTVQHAGLYGLKART